MLLFGLASRFATSHALSPNWTLIRSSNSSLFSTRYFKSWGIKSFLCGSGPSLGFRIFVVVRISPSEGSMKEISFVWVSTFTSSSFPTYPHGTLYRTFPNRIWLLGRTFLLITLLCAEYAISGSGRSRFLSSALYRLNRLLPGRSVSSALLSWASNGSIALFISSMLKKLRLLRWFRILSWNCLTAFSTRALCRLLPGSTAYPRVL